MILEITNEEMQLAQARDKMKFVSSVIDRTKCGFMDAVETYNTIQTHLVLVPVVVIPADINKLESEIEWDKPSAVLEYLPENQSIYSIDPVFQQYRDYVRKIVREFYEGYYAKSEEEGLVHAGHLQYLLDNLPIANFSEWKEQQNEVLPATE